MVKRLLALLILSLALLGCAEVAVKDDSAPQAESGELTPQDLMYEERQRIQQQMLHESRPMRIGPGRR